MGYLEKIYDRSPIFFQNFMTSTLGFIQKKQRYGKEYFEHLKYLEDFNRLSYARKSEIQFKMFKQFITDAKNNSPLYAELYKDIDLDTINSFEDAKKLPFVDKEILRSNIDKVYTIPKKGAVLGFTGGTTGKALCVRFTREDFERRMAALDSFKSRHGFDNLQMKKATFNGKSLVPVSQKEKIFWRYNAPCKQMMYSTFNITEENLKYYVESLNRFKPVAIDGFFMAMCDVASYIERNNLKLTFKPVAIFPTSETITDGGRELLERVFGCKVYNQYASSEGAPFVTECRCGRLHLDMASGYIEEIDPQTHEVAVTSFTTHGTPLIRYKIGDCIKLSAGTSCECGAESVIAESIDGRKMSYLYSSDGAKISEANISNMFKHIPPSIIHTQAVQNEIGVVELYMVTDEKSYKKEYEKILYEEFYSRFGKDSTLNIHYVDSIPRASSGKFRLVVNNVDKG